jgi:hypothetical protein
MQGRKPSAKSRKQSRTRARGVVDPSQSAAAPIFTKDMLLSPGRDPLQPLRVSFDTLLNRAADLLEAGGMSSQEIGRLLRAKATQFAQGKRADMRLEFSHFAWMIFMANVLHDWSRELQFLGSDGEPRPLPIRGPGLSLEMLVRRQVPRSKVSAAIAWLEKAGFVTRDTAGRAVAQKRHAIVARGSPGPLMSERGLSLAAQLLSTARHNYGLEGPIYTDRQAHVGRLSVRHFRQFHEFVSAQAGVFIETIDNWLDDHQATEPGEASVVAAVHVYMFKGRATKVRKQKSK